MKATLTRHAGEIVLQINRRDERLLAEAAREAAVAPFRLKQILVPIDFSDCSKKALAYAVPLAKQHEASLTLLYCIPTNYAVGEYGGLAYAPLEAEMRARSMEQLKGLVATDVHGGVSADTLVHSGSPAAEIVEVARTMPADIIVLSTHGRSGLKHVLLGSVAEHVVRHAPCPVLVVREKEREFVV